MTTRKYAECDMCGCIMESDSDWQRLEDRKFGILQGVGHFDSYLVTHTMGINGREGRKLTLYVGFRENGHVCPDCLLELIKIWKSKLKKAVKEKKVRYCNTAFIESAKKNANKKGKSNSEVTARKFKTE